MQQIDDLLQGVYDLLMKAYPENCKFPVNFLLNQNTV